MQQPQAGPGLRDSAGEGARTAAERSGTPPLPRTVPAQSRGQRKKKKPPGAAAAAGAESRKGEPSALAPSAPPGSLPASCGLGIGVTAAVSFDLSLASFTGGLAASCLVLAGKALPGSHDRTGCRRLAGGVVGERKQTRHGERRRPLPSTASLPRLISGKQADVTQPQQRHPGQPTVCQRASHHWTGGWGVGGGRSHTSPDAAWPASRQDRLVQRAWRLQLWTATRSCLGFCFNESKLLVLRLVRTTVRTSTLHVQRQPRERLPGRDPAPPKKTWHSSVAALGGWLLGLVGGWILLLQSAAPSLGVGGGPLRVETAPQLGVWTLGLLPASLSWKWPEGK